jgi:acyl carrier protein
MNSGRNSMEKFLENMIEIFEKADIDLDDEFRNFEEWDSLAYMSVVAMIDDNYDVVIPGEEFQKLIKIRDIYNYIQDNH